MLKESTFSRKP